MLFKDTHTPLSEKIFKVMKELFKLIGAQPVLPATKDMGDSESDYDEFDINLGN